MLRRPKPGTRLLFRWRKWDGSPHWEHECVYLGADEWGDWFGQLPGWHSRRPGATFDTDCDRVTLMPSTADYALTVHRAHPRIRVYVDLAWDVAWAEGLPYGIDMDLDVVLSRDRPGAWIDDETEWDENRVRYGYPADVQRHLRALADVLVRRVDAGTPPFDVGTAGCWLDRLAALPAR